MVDESSDVMVEAAAETVSPARPDWRAPVLRTVDISETADGLNPAPDNGIMS
ncbi:hypothetical protein [Oleisolibacter albus]|uniref:hypothetical protein n=1 Tax=Oleisolibacter albus TaxID=2171757 RepID=UPI0012D7F169|nr:hypothetical protein [Oleisolibacter albus]